MHQSSANQDSISNINLDSFRTKSQKVIAKLLIVTLLVLDIPLVPLLGSINTAQAAALVTDRNAWVTVTPKADPIMQNLNIPANAATQGMWSTPFAWPMNGLHNMILPDGKVLTFGTNADGGAQDGRTFDIWDPSLGFGANSHNTSYQAALQDSFCSTATYLNDGNMLITGGNAGNGGYGKGSVIYNPNNNSRATAQAVTALPRWYSTMIGLPDGRKLVMGGMAPYAEGMFNDPEGAIARGEPSMTPEIYDNGAWRSLFGANSRLAFGPDFLRTSFPHAFVAPNGLVFGISADRMWYLDVNTNNGNGAVYDFGQFKPGYGNKPDPDNVGALSVAVMYDIGKIIQAGGNGGFNGDGLPSSNKATSIDINGGGPVLTELPRMNIPRRYGNGIVLANGEVVITGGTRFGNDGGGNAVYAAEIWNPIANNWRLGANAATIRVYHSISSLLLNGAIISTGGGTPGPVLNKTGEVYYPPYLFEQIGGASRLAARPAIKGISGLKYAHGATMQMDMDSTAAIRGLSLIALSNGTHSFNNSQRRIPLQFTQEDNRLTAAIPNANLTPPGYYQVVALNAQGVPSYANVIAVGAQMAPPQVATTPYDPGTATPPVVNVPPTVALTAPAAGSAYTQGATVAITATAADSDGSVAYVDFFDGGTLLGSDTTAPYSFNWVTASAAIGGHNISAAAVDNAGARTVSAVRNITINALSNTADSDGDGIVDAIDLYPNDASRGAGIWREQYNNIGFGVTVADLTSAAKFPNAPDVIAKMTTFTSPNDLGDAYGSRMRGVFTAPETGAYTFWVTGDDETRLYLSTDSNVANKRQIAFVPGWSLSNEWTKYPEQKSATINLVAGQKYYLEVLHKEGGGGDGIAVAWQTPSNPTRTVMTDQYFQATPTSVSTLISQGKTATQSSVDYGGEASRAVDGNTSGLWGDNSTTHTTFENQPWWQVDLGQSSPLSRVIVWNRKDCCSDRLQNFYVLVSNNDMTGKTLAQLLADPTVKSTQVASLNGATNTTVQIGNTSARYVRVQLSGANFLSLGEVQVYGDNTATPLPTVSPTASTQITYETRTGASGRVWVVNPDNDSVSVLDAVTNALVREIPVGIAPRTLAIAPNGNIWVTNKDSASISVISPTTLVVLQTIAMPRASQPYGLAFAPNGTHAYVVLEALGQVRKLDPANGALVGTIAVGNNPRHVSVTADSSTLLVSRFITPALPGEATATVDTSTAGAEVIAVNAGAMTLNKTIVLRHSDKADTTITGSGIPNYLGAAVISPDGKTAWVPSKQDNIKRGIARNGQPLNFQNTVRAISSNINMTTLTEDLARRIDHDNSSVGSAALYHPSGNHLFVALETSREVAVIDPATGVERFRLNVGRAPQGLALSPDGNTIYVQEFMNRSVGVFDLKPLTQQGLSSAINTNVIFTVTTEKMSAQAVLGKQLFYDAKDPRLSLDSYMSCASCHNDGGHDGRIWDLTGFGEGLRNTISLKGRAAMGHGNLHWSANFDELQDFEGQIRTLAGGKGLMTDTQFNTGTRNQPLGDKKAGVSQDLDDLAAYVASLNTFAQSPNRNTDGTLTAPATAGKTVFANSCASCHGGANFTTSTDGNNLKNIGTINALSGKRLNATLAGIDVPTLRDAWATAPYLHNGSATTVTAAVQAHNNLTLNATDLANVVAYVQQIGGEEAAVVVTPPNNPAGDTDGDGIVDALDLYPNDANRGAGIWREQYNAIGGGNLVADLTAAAKFPNAPDVIEKVATFAGPTNIAEAYGSRIRGIFTAPTTGAFTFWVAGDNEARLFLSTDNTAANKRQIAYVPVWTDANQWAIFPEQKSAVINLVAGQNYYLEVLHKEGDGGDNVSVAWQTPTNNAITVMTDQFFQKARGTVTPPPPANVAPTVAITAPAAGMAIIQGATVAITASAADSDGTVARVEFYDGAVLLGTDTTAPYAVNWATSAATATGAHSLTVRAYDNVGAVTTSAAVSVTVNTSATVSQNIAPSATLASSNVSPWETLSAVNNNTSHTSSRDKNGGAYGNWRGAAGYGQTDWVSFTWSTSRTLNAFEVYWWNDGLGIATPTDARVEYWNGSAWISLGSIGIALDQYNRLAFSPISTTSIRVSMKSTLSTGILEARVLGN